MGWKNQQKRCTGQNMGRKRKRTAQELSDPQQRKSDRRLRYYQVQERKRLVLYQDCWQVLRIYLFAARAEGITIQYKKKPGRYPSAGRYCIILKHLKFATHLPPQMSKNVQKQEKLNFEEC